MVLVRDAVIAGPAGGDLAAVDGPAASGRSQASDGPNRLGSESVPVRVYEPGGPDMPGSADPWGTLVWAHGGSFVRGTLDWPEADWASRRFAEAGLRVYSVDYVLASAEVKAPAPSNDVAAVLREVRAMHDGPVFVGGASAGGHLATLAALAQADAAASLGDPTLRPDALALIYPTLHRVQRPDAAISALTDQLPEARRFGPERVAEMYDFYLGEDLTTQSPATFTTWPPVTPASHGSTTPLVAGELPTDRLAALPPTIIVNAEADDLRASAEQFAEQLRLAGVDVTDSRQPGTVHGYLNRPEESPRAIADANTTIELLVNGLVQALVMHSGAVSMAALQRLVSPTATRAVAGLPLLPTLIPARAYPVGYGRLFWRSLGWVFLIIAGLIGISFFSFTNGMRFLLALRGYEVATALAIVAVGLLAFAGATRMYGLTRARLVREEMPQAVVIEQLHQCAGTFYELLALGGSVPRNGQFGYFTLGASRQGITIRRDRGVEALNVPRARVLEVGIEPRLPVQAGGSASRKPHTAIVITVRCEEGARQLSLFVGDPRWLGMRPMGGERLQSVLHSIERALQLGEPANRVQDPGN